VRPPAAMNSSHVLPVNRSSQILVLFGRGGAGVRGVSLRPADGTARTGDGRSPWFSVLAIPRERGSTKDERNARRYPEGMFAQLIVHTYELNGQRAPYYGIVKVPVAATFFETISLSGSTPDSPGSWGLA
jgi:hypothetical protein